MSEGSIVAIILGVLGILGGGGLWTYLGSRKKAPIEKRDADLTAAHTSQEMALLNAKRAQEMAEWALRDLSRVRDRVTTLEDHTVQQDLEISRLNRTIRVLSGWVDDIIANWSHYRQRDHPPPRPTITD